MFKKSNRLGKTSDVQKVFARGRAFFNPLFTIKFAKAPGAVPRFTVVVSTKVSKKAVERNRLKRVIREFIRLRLGSFQSGDYVIMVKPAAAGKPGAELTSRLKDICKTSKLAAI